jgi:hypothetical protein
MQVTCALGAGDNQSAQKLGFDLDKRRIVFRYQAAAIDSGFVSVKTASGSNFFSCSIDAL